MPMFLVFVDSVMAYAIYMSLFVSVLFSKSIEKGIFNGYTLGCWNEEVFKYIRIHAYIYESSHYYAKKNIKAFCCT